MTQMNKMYETASRTFEEYYRIEMDQGKGIWTTVIPVCLDHQSASKIISAIRAAGDTKTNYRIIKINQKIYEEYKGSDD